MEDNFSGVWGNLREKYLKENKPKMYDVLVETGDLEEYLTSYQISYSYRADKIFQKLMTESGINEELYEKNSLEWIIESEKIEEQVKAILKKEIQK